MALNEADNHLAASLEAEINEMQSKLSTLTRRIHKIKGTKKEKRIKIKQKGIKLAQTPQPIPAVVETIEPVKKRKEKLPKGSETLLKQKRVKNKSSANKARIEGEVTEKTKSKGRKKVGLIDNFITNKTAKTISLPETVPLGLEKKEVRKQIFTIQSQKS